MADLLCYKLNENLWRVWHADRPDMSFTMDTHVGLCTCEEGKAGPPAGYGCIHVELKRDQLFGRGIPKQKAREVAKQTLSVFKADEFVRSAKVLGIEERDGMVSNIKFDICFRGRGRPCTFEGRKRGVNLTFRTNFHINIPDAPILNQYKFPDKKPKGWERVF